ncbi:hypothetical protein C1645_734739 [Glomus cerebriforme]|uniref:Uncharacterized protein n=1 Tax=Glomus cerebriforme TaxID=658196 RepID=A0A397T8H5_9GLOM|nr:hypothetical protein C1645_734739 [Glomus cerebriforme]
MNLKIFSSGDQNKVDHHLIHISLKTVRKRLSHQAIITGLPPTVKKSISSEINIEFKDTFNWEAIKMVKTKDKGNKLIGFFGHHDDLIKAIRQPFVNSGNTYNWTPDNVRSNKSADTKSRGAKDTSKKDKKSSKHDKRKNRPKARSSSNSSTGSIAEGLVTLVQLLTKQESKKSRKKTKSRGGSRTN